jgi:2-methylfumaryl-CoA isomerase
MGWLAEADIRGTARPRHGNHLFGSFGSDFATADSHRLMVVALTEGQWRALRDVTETGKVFEALEHVLDADLSREDDRYQLRETIAAVLRPWFEQRDFATVRELLNRAHVLWSPYSDMAQAAAASRALVGLVEEIDQAGIGDMLAAGSPVRWEDARQAPEPAPVLGADTDEVLTTSLGLTQADLGRLREGGIIGAGLRADGS